MVFVNWVSSFDSFARLPKDLTEVTATGGVFSIVSVLGIITLMALEFNQLFTLETTTSLEMDPSNHLEMKIHFNITMLDLPCDFTQIDIIDTFGTNQLDFTAGIKKVRLHHEKGAESWVRGEDQKHELIKSSEGSGQDFQEYLQSLGDEAADFPTAKHAPDVDPDTFDNMIKYFPIVFVNFYAPWCIWSKRMAGEWEKTAEAVDQIRWPRKEIHVKMIRVDCEAHSSLCARYHVRGYPTMYMFKNRAIADEPYRQDRRQAAWVKHIQSHVQSFEMDLPNVFHDIGCEVSGVIVVNRCPGNFHLQAKSDGHSISPAMANVSHTVNHLSFGRKLRPSLREELPDNLLLALSPLNGKTYTTDDLHQSPQHYIKVVPTLYRVDTGMISVEDADTYQWTSTNRIAKVKKKDIPQAKFKYNFSPVSIRIQHERMSFYHFLTRFFAVLGGAYTVLIFSKDGMESVTEAITAPVRPVGILGTPRAKTRSPRQR